MLVTRVLYGFVLLVIFVSVLKTQVTVVNLIDSLITKTMTYNYTFKHSTKGIVEVDASSLTAAKYRLQRYEDIDPNELTLESTTDLNWSSKITKQHETSTTGLSYQKI